MILTADLHTHSVFSDGHVWPSIRVEEADRDGLDALAFTEHLEHQPRKADIPHPDRNRSYQVAIKEAANRQIGAVMLINGAEITRGMPPGHVNAVFLQDANKVLTDDPADAIRAANDQGAFVFWNHPNWLPQAMLRYAILPQVMPRAIASTLYLLDRNMRMATVIGIVGAGGIGQELKGRYDMYDYGHVGTIPVAIFLVVFLLDRLASRLRRATL